MFNDGRNLIMSGKSVTGDNSEEIRANMFIKEYKEKK